MISFDIRVGTLGVKESEFQAGVHNTKQEHEMRGTWPCRGFVGSPGSDENAFLTGTIVLPRA